MVIKYVAIATVERLVETGLEYSEETEHIALSEVTSYAEAMQRIEDFYGDNLVKATIELLDYHFIPLTLDYLQKLREDDIY